MTTDEILAGTEYQGIRDEINKIKDEVIRRIEVLTGLEAQSVPMADHAELGAIREALDTQFEIVEEYCLARIVRKAEAEGLA